VVNGPRRSFLESWVGLMLLLIGSAYAIQFTWTTLRPLLPVIITVLIAGFLVRAVWVFRRNRY
jgi:hypothetical protein